VIAHLLAKRRTVVPNGGRVTVRMHVPATPVTVSIVSTTVPVSVDPRRLAEQPAFKFVPDR